MFRFTQIVAAMFCAALTTSSLAQSSGKMSIRPSNTSAPDDDRGSAQTTDLKRITARELMQMLRSEDVNLIDVTRRIASTDRQRLTEEASFHGATHSYVLRMKQSNDAILCWRFESEHALEINAAHYAGTLRYKNLLLHNLDCSTYEWQRINETLLDAGGAIEYRIAESRAAMMLSQLATIRAQIELYSAVHDSPPDFTTGWSDLLENEFLTTAPKSVLSTHEDPSRVVVIARPGATGEDGDPSEAGWVWNSADQTFHVAGFAESQLRNVEEGRERITHQLIEIQTKYALNGPQWAKDSIVKYHLGNMRATMAYFYADSAVAGNAAYPTFDEMKASKDSLHEVGINPFNGCDTIQPAQWDATNPPVFGTAGWNYDEKQGKFWANTREENAHKL